MGRIIIHAYAGSDLATGWPTLLSTDSELSGGPYHLSHSYRVTVPPEWRKGPDGRLFAPCGFTTPVSCEQLPRAIYAPVDLVEGDEGVVGVVTSTRVILGGSRRGVELVATGQPTQRVALPVA